MKDVKNTDLTYTPPPYFDQTLQAFWEAALEQCPWVMLTPTHLILDGGKFPFDIGDEALFYDICKNFKWLKNTRPTEKHVLPLKDMTLSLPLGMFDEVKDPAVVNSLKTVSTTVWNQEKNIESQSEKLVKDLMLDLMQVLKIFKIQKHPLTKKFQEILLALQAYLDTLSKEYELIFNEKKLLTIQQEKLFPFFGSCHVTAFDSLFSSNNFKSLAGELQKTRSDLLAQVLCADQNELSVIFQGRLWKHYVKDMQKLLCSHASGEFENINHQRVWYKRLSHQINSSSESREKFCEMLSPIRDIFFKLTLDYYSHNLLCFPLEDKSTIVNTATKVNALMQNQYPTKNSYEEHLQRCVELLLYQMILNSPPILLCAGGFLVRSVAHKTIHLSSDLLATEITRKVLGHLPKDSQWTQWAALQEHDGECDNAEKDESQESSHNFDINTATGEVFWNTVREKNTENFGFVPVW